MIRLQREPIDPELIRRSLEGTDAGGVALFCGEVRAVTGEVRTERVVYTAYEPMALEQMERLAREAASRWKARVALVHRLGELRPGDIAVVTAAACAHRAEAFEACRFLIERLKADVPIWKQEFGPGGAVIHEGERTVQVDRADEVSG
jgi:molybdopterin synthase catalytic subunit